MPDALPIIVVALFVGIVIGVGIVCVIARSVDVKDSDDIF